MNDKTLSNRILGAGYVLVTRMGYDRITLDHIAQEARVSKTDILKIFESKEKLLNRIMTCATDNIFKCGSKKAVGKVDGVTRKSRSELDEDTQLSDNDREFSNRLIYFSA